MQKVKIITATTAEVVNPFEPTILIGGITHYNQKWIDFERENPPLPIHNPEGLKVEIGSEVDAELVEHCSCTNEFMISTCEYGNDFHCEAKSWQILPAKEEKPDFEQTDEGEVIGYISFRDGDLHIDPVTTPVAV